MIHGMDQYGKLLVVLYITLRRRDKLIVAAIKQLTNDGSILHFKFAAHAVRTDLADS